MRIRGALPISQLVVAGCGPVALKEDRAPEGAWFEEAASKKDGAAQANLRPSDSSGDGSGDGGTGGDAILGANDSAVYSRFLTVHGVARQQ